MSKIIECILFFQETDILKIRLEYLFDEIDYFVILESSQTFSGKKKEFIFEKNIDQFSKYQNKIIYYKLDEFHTSYESIINLVENIADPVRKKIINVINQLTHYNTKHLPWVLDTYQREMLHFPLSKIVNNDDIIILSDLDEIPSIEFIKYYKKNNLKIMCSAYQREFNFFLNYFRNNKWIGSLIFRANNLLDISFNEIRQKSKNIKSNKILHLPVFGGYHFTTVGDEKTIKNKIESWAHQEFNSNFIKNDIQKNIKTGQDVFNRNSGTVLKKVLINDIVYFDQRMSKIISKYENLLSLNEISFIESNPVRIIKNKFLKIIHRIFFEIKIKIKK